MESALYGIFTRVEIFDTSPTRVKSAFHAVICLFYTYRDSAILKNIS